MKRPDLNLNTFIGGWLVGDFSPALFKRTDIEVGIKKLDKGFVDKAHWHEKSTEYNFIIAGRMRLETGQTVKEGEAFSYKPNEVSECAALEDTIILVIRDASVSNDKYT